MKRTIDLRATVAVFVVGLCLVAVSVSAIDLDGYLELVKANHPFFQKEKLAVEVEQSKRQTLLPRYEWNYSLLPQYTIADGQVSSQYFENLSQNVALQAGMERSYADGRRMGFSVSTGYTWMQNPPSTMQENSFQHGIEASFSWSLKKNIERLELAEEQLATTNRMYRANLVDKLDVMRVEDAIRTAQQAILEYESLAKSIQAVLATLSDSKDILNDQPDVEFYSFTELPSAAEAAARGRARTRLKKPLLVVIEQLRFHREAIGEREKDTLDLFLEAGIYGPQDSFVDSLEIAHTQATIGLSYPPAVGSEQLESERQLISTQIEQLEKEIETLEKTVETNLASVLIQASELEKIIELNRQLIDSAEAKAVEEARLYGQGRNILTNVIQSRDSVQE